MYAIMRKLDNIQKLLNPSYRDTQVHLIDVESYDDNKKTVVDNETKVVFLDSNDVNTNEKMGYKDLILQFHGVKTILDHNAKSKTYRVSGSKTRYVLRNDADLGPIEQGYAEDGGQKRIIFINPTEGSNSAQLVEARAKQKHEHLRKTLWGKK